MNSKEELERIVEMVEFYAKRMSPMDNWVVNLDGTATIYAPTPIPEVFRKAFNEEDDQ